MEENPQDRQKYIEQLYQALIRVPLLIFQKRWRPFKIGTKIKTTNYLKKIYLPAFIYMLVSLMSVVKKSLLWRSMTMSCPPVSLTQEEMEMLNGGVRLVQIKRALLKIPDSFKS